VTVEQSSESSQESLVPLDITRRSRKPRYVSNAFQKSILVVTSFVFSLCDFVDLSFCPEN